MTPSRFEDELNARCGGTGSSQYRLRWSQSTGSWCVEQKVSRATEIPTEGTDADVSIRVQDGYGLVMQFSPLPIMTCPECRREILLPRLEIAEVRCDWCNSQPGDLYERKMWFTGYFPLCDALLVHLEKTAPKREGAWVAEIEADNIARAAAIKRRFANAAEACALEYWNQVAQVPRVGYGTGPASFGVL